MYSERIELYRQLETKRESRVIVYVTGDRRGLETKIASEVLDLFVEHLDRIGSVGKISLYLYTTGGVTLAAWGIANLIRQFCNEFEVIVPAKAHSAGTLISLGADTIIMTKQATLGPIDPSVNTPLNPTIPGAPDTARMPVSVEAINGFIELAKETGIRDSSDYATVLSILTQHVHPLVLGEVYRTRSQIRMLGERLLSKHLDDTEGMAGRIEKILDFLCSESGSHDYKIYRQEARDELGLNVEEPDDTLYVAIKDIHDDVANELQLQVPYDPRILLGGQTSTKYELPRALVESTAGGSHRFVSVGHLAKRSVTDPNTGVTHERIQDNRTFEGWRHEGFDFSGEGPEAAKPSSVF